MSTPEPDAGRRAQQGWLVADLIARARTSGFVGRDAELALLAGWFAPDGPPVGFVYGQGGIGKTALVNAALSRQNRQAVWVDCTLIEPTEAGGWAAIGQALGQARPPDRVSLAEDLRSRGATELVLDGFERINLLDAWVRNELVPSLPATMTTFIVGRRPPNLAWRAGSGWRNLVVELEVRPLRDAAVREILTAQRVPAAHHENLVRLAHGHPLALEIAVRAAALSLDLAGAHSTGELAEELFEHLVDDLDAEERASVDAAAVLRRVTIPLLRDVLPDHDPDRAWRTLRRSPLTRLTDHGIELTGIARATALDVLERRDPDRVRALRSNAASAILSRLHPTPDWETTADLMHLVHNPVIRHAYAPPGALQHPAERARADDQNQVAVIANEHGGRRAEVTVSIWWPVSLDSFTVTRGPGGSVTAFSIVARLTDILATRLRIDPIVERISAHIDDDKLGPGDDALLVRLMLSRDHGEGPSPELAILVTDLKRAYLALRSTLRRVYVAVTTWDEVAPTLGPMGFVPLHRRAPAAEALAVLDFGEQGVDGWIARHVLQETRPANLQQHRGTTDGIVGSHSDAPALSGLTPREMEVITVLAEGRTNAQIAERLFISERTANRHISNIFLKLGVNNRTEAGRLAVLSGLAG